MKPEPEEWVTRVASRRLITEFISECREEADCLPPRELAVGVQQNEEQDGAYFVQMTRAAMADCVVRCGGDPEGILDAPIGMVPVLFIGVSGKSLLSYWGDEGFSMAKGGTA